MIPLSVPHIAGNEWNYVKECLDTGWISSTGAFVDRFEQAVARFTGAAYGVACMNGTTGLHLCLRIMGVQTGDYVIAPNVTFIASINAIRYTGADPILIDVDPGTWQLDLDLLERFLQEQARVAEGELTLKTDGRRIKAIMPVHVLGNMGDIDRLQMLAERYGLGIIEDATEALGSYYRGRHAGTFGSAGVFSFNGNKIISTGGGGMIVTDDERLARRAKHLSTQAKVSAGEYIHDAVGYNYRLVNVLAAIGVAQMELLPDFIRKKHTMDTFYRSHLSGVGDIRFQRVDNPVQPNCWLFTLRTDRMRALLEYLNHRQVQSRPFWMPMNQLPMFERCLYITEQDVSRRVYESSLSIPSSVGLSREQLRIVVQTIQAFFSA